MNHLIFGAGSNGSARMLCAAKKFSRWIVVLVHIVHVPVESLVSISKISEAMVAELVCAGFVASRSARTPVRKCYWLSMQSQRAASGGRPVSLAAGRITLVPATFSGTTNHAEQSVPALYLARGPNGDGRAHRFGGIKN